jgi:hypothetical protein
MMDCRSTMVVQERPIDHPPLHTPANSVLDRVGLKAPEKLDVAVGPTEVTLVEKLYRAPSKTSLAREPE